MGAGSSRPVISRSLGCPPKTQVSGASGWPTVTPAQGALDGLKVLDLATLFAGPLAATMLGDFGADVIKIEHPRGRPVARPRPAKDGVGLWWKMLGRNKRTDHPRPRRTRTGRRCFLAPGRDRRRPRSRTSGPAPWSAGASARRSSTRSTRGWSSPASPASASSARTPRRPGFGTLAEAMSGFAAITGEPDGPPTLPPFGLADAIAGARHGVRRR